MLMMGGCRWNAAKALATYLDEHVDLYYKKNVLELGAGGGLPSIVTALNGAGKVVLTDYPDDSLVDNMLHNVRTNLGHDTTNIVTRGYIWGRNVDPLVSLLEPSQKFDLLILSDLIFNHSQHDALLKTALETLSPGGVVLVFYTHHRPHLAHRDMQFFELAKDQGWQCEEVLKRHFDPMFPEDPGDAEVRSTVHGWSLKRHELL
ncbi:putative methyltransferase-domain-containing protein [Flagelloscypha sp. PMI_526]|nr:putative methyltransferase-domain-containing protein [Flagelloscypha sp. PMI_526]